MFFIVGLLISFGILGRCVDPQISDDCIAAISAYGPNFEANTRYHCSSTIIATIQDQDAMTLCLKGGQGGYYSGYDISCQNPNSVMNAANNPNQWLVRPYWLPSQPSKCTFCNSTIRDSCDVLLTSISTLASGLGSDADIAIPGGEAVAAACSGYFDFAQLTGLRYQSKLLCASSDTYNLTVTSVNTLDGILDMRSLLQCGTCSMIPCLPGQYCGKNRKAEMCPAGSYCPLPMIIKTCPKDHYCPLGSTEPVACRSIATGSCDEGSTREVVWVPLFISLLLLLFIGAICLYPPPFIEGVLGKLKVSGLATKVSPTFKALPTFGNFDEAKKLPGVSIEFEDLVMISGTNTRLNKLSGHISPGRFTAIIGGSGAGKTTLMNVILSREQKTSGAVKFFAEGSSEPLSAKVLERVVSFVPQTDVLLTEMTVRQLLLHSASMRLPPQTSYREIEAKVDHVLEKLDISHLSDIIAKRASSDGDVLSPGDKKKVSIGIELVANPRVCVLDEPTTGIDASSAMSVAIIIKDLAASGVTCIAVIHQPRGEIFSLIDDIIILVPGGRVAYDGPANRALEWFAQFGFHISHPKANKADFILDVTSGSYGRSQLDDGSQVVVAREDDEESIPLGVAPQEHDPEAGGKRGATGTGTGTDTPDWAALWTEKGRAFIESKSSTDHSAPAVVVQDREQQGLKTPLAGMSQIKELAMNRPGFLFQLQLCFYRALLQRVKSLNLFINMLICLLGGAIIGIVTSGGPLLLPAVPSTYSASCPPGAEFECREWLRFEVGPATFLITMIIGAVTFPVAVSTFGREKEYLAREAAVGINKTAYYFGKIFADFLMMCITMLMFVSALVAIAPWRAPFEVLYAVALSISAVSSSIGYFLSFAVNEPDNAVLIGVILAILLNLFGGFVPMLGDDPVGLFFYTHYSARAICAAEVQEGMGLTTQQYNYVVPEPWMDPDWGFDVLVLWIFTAAFHVVSFFYLFRKNPRKFRE